MTKYQKQVHRIATIIAIESNKLKGNGGHPLLWNDMSIDSKNRWIESYYPLAEIMIKEMYYAASETYRATSDNLFDCVNEYYIKEGLIKDDE